MSKRAVIAAPMSFAGSAERAWMLTGRPHGTGWNMVGRSAAYVGVVLLIAVWWAVIACWYLAFGVLLVPYRLVRRGQRKRAIASQRHAELLVALRERVPDIRP